MLAAIGSRAELDAGACVLLRVPVARNLHAPKHLPLVLAVLVLLVLLAVGFGTGVIGGSDASVRGAGTPAGALPSRQTSPLAVRPPGGLRHRAAESRRPNIVFVLTDDLSMDLVRFMPEVQALATRGATFDNYFVSDSLCCPSRSSIFTGKFPHDTGVFANGGADGGIGAFYANGNEETSFNIALQQAGYRTAMMGKYLNGYLQDRSPVPGTYVPPGWSEWDVAGWGYRGVRLPDEHQRHGASLRPRPTGLPDECDDPARGGLHRRLGQRCTSRSSLSSRRLRRIRPTFPRPATLRSSPGSPRRVPRTSTSCRPTHRAGSPAMRR